MIVACVDCGKEDDIIGLTLGHGKIYRCGDCSEWRHTEMYRLFGEHVLVEVTPARTLVKLRSMKSVGGGCADVTFDLVSTIGHGPITKKDACEIGRAAQDFVEIVAHVLTRAK